MNIVLPPITLTLLLLFLPPFLVFKLISCIKRYITSEKVAGKVVLITGASSGIGEVGIHSVHRFKCLSYYADLEPRIPKRKHWKLVTIVTGTLLTNALNCILWFLKYLAYEYARRGACLALAARREERLRAVADKARMLGSPDVIVISTDISKVEDCERFITEAVNHFGRCKDLLSISIFFFFSKK